MAYYLVAAGTNLYRVSPDGTVTTLTLPTGATITSGRRPRFAVLGEHAIVVNAPTRPLWIDRNDNVRFVGIPKPHNKPTIAVGAAGAYSGTVRIKYSYLVKDRFGNVLSESPLSEPSDEVVFTSDKIVGTEILPSPYSWVNARRIYRTATGPTTNYFEWMDIDNNTSTTFTDDASDLALSIFAAPDDLGPVPGNAVGLATHVTQWQDRIWMVADEDVDLLNYSANRKFYAFPAANGLYAQPKGRDKYGITALIARRDELGVCKRKSLLKVVGDSEDTYELIRVVEGGGGCVSQESAVVINDIAYYLGEDGVYRWSANGVDNISKDRVHPWFTTDTYFNRAQFVNSFAKWNPLFNAYELHLAAAASSSIDRWVMFTIDTGKWWGPFRTAAFTPVSAALIEDTNDNLLPVICASDGYIYKMNQATRSDVSATTNAIDFDVITGPHAQDTPDIYHLWLEMAVLNKIQATAGELDVLPYVGELDAAVQAAIRCDLRSGRQRLRRLGPGRFAKIRFRENSVGQDVTLYGYEIPGHELGRR